MHIGWWCEAEAPPGESEGQHLLTPVGTKKKKKKKRKKASTPFTVTAQLRVPCGLPTPPYIKTRLRTSIWVAPSVGSLERAHTILWG